MTVRQNVSLYSLVTRAKKSAREKSCSPFTHACLVIVQSSQHRSCSIAMSHQDFNPINFITSCHTQTASVQGFNAASSPSFALLRSEKPASYDLDVNHSKALRFDQLQVEADENGNCKAALYGSGAFIRRLDLYLILKAANNSLWLGDRFGGWHPLD